MITQLRCGHVDLYTAGALRSNPGRRARQDRGALLRKPGARGHKLTPAHANCH